MGWTEPWAAVIGDRPPYRLGWEQLVQGLKLGIVLLAIFLLSALVDPGDLQLKLSRVWLAFPLGVVLSLLIYSISWGFPGTIGSGPKGIVRDSGGVMLIVPWGAIASYSLTVEKKAKVLKITTHDGSAYRFLAPLRYPPDKIIANLREYGIEA